MEIIGRIKNCKVIKCAGGFYHKSPIYGTGSSGCFCCEHVEGDIYYDFVNVKALEEITDKKIIESLI